MTALLFLSLLSADPSKVLFVKIDDAKLYATPDAGSKVLTKLKKGDALAWKETSTVNGAMQDVTLKKLHGFVRTVDVTPFKAEDDPNQGEPQPLSASTVPPADETGDVELHYHPTDPAELDAIAALHVLQASSQAQRAHVPEHKIKVKGKK